MSLDAFVAAADDLENPRDAVWAEAGAFTLTTAGLTLKGRCGCWRSISWLRLVGKCRMWWTRTQRLGSCQFPPSPFLLQLGQSHAGSHGQPQGEKKHEGDAARASGMTRTFPHSH